MLYVHGRDSFRVIKDISRGKRDYPLCSFCIEKQPVRGGTAAVRSKKQLSGSRTIKEDPGLSSSPVAAILTVIIGLVIIHHAIGSPDRIVQVFAGIPDGMPDGDAVTIP